MRRLFLFAFSAMAFKSMFSSKGNSIHSASPHDGSISWSRREDKAGVLNAFDIDLQCCQLFER